MKVLSSSLTPISKFGLLVLLPLLAPLWFFLIRPHPLSWIPGVIWCAAAAFGIWWSLPIKKVSLVGDRLRISNYRREIEVSVADIVKIEESRANRSPNISLWFDPPTAFGRRVRIMTPMDFTGEEFDRVLDLLHCAIEARKPAPPIAR